MTEQQLAPWLRGQVPGVPAALSPVAHALQQTVEEATEFVEGFPDELLWQPVAGLATVGFHLRHMAGVIDRLFTYARGEQLSDEQRLAQRSEGTPPEQPVSVGALLGSLSSAVDAAITQLRATDPATLTDERLIGSKRIPSTVMGALFHAAEHSQRHVGQLLVTARVLVAGGGAGG